MVSLDIYVFPDVTSCEIINVTVSDDITVSCHSDDVIGITSPLRLHAAETKALAADPINAVH